MAYRIDSGIINEKFLSEIKRNEINEAFASLETCKQSHTSPDSKNLQQVYFNNVKVVISDLERKIEESKNEIKKLERLKENMKTKFEEVKALHDKSIKEQKFGKTARSRSRSRDREEEKIEEKAKELFATERGMFDNEKKEGCWSRLPPGKKNKYKEMVNKQIGGRTRKNKK